MKKKRTDSKKLGLAKETVRKLTTPMSDKELEGVAGGNPPMSNTDACVSR